MAAIFKRFQARYGNKWTSSLDGIEETAVAEWADGLAGLTGEQIAQGLRTWRDDWPPSLPEFRVACASVPYHRPFSVLRLPLVRSDESKRLAAEYIANIRRILGTTQAKADSGSLANDEGQGGLRSRDSEISEPGNRESVGEAAVGAEA